MNRPCEMFRPSSNQECSPDDSGPYLAQSPAPEKRKDLRKHPSSLPSFLEPLAEECDGGRQEVLSPGPSSRPCLQKHLQCSKSVSSQATSYHLCGLAPLQAGTF